MVAKCILGVVLLGLVQAHPALRDGSPMYIEDMRRGSPRVVGGWEAEEGQIPHQISLRMINEVGSVSSCGGSVIHNEWIMTAAHCVANRVNFVVRLGVQHVDRPEHIVEVPRANAYLHPNYIEQLVRVQADDIAVMKLTQSVPYGPTVQPIRLQNSLQKDDDYTGVRLMVSGFGRTDDSWHGGTASDVLLWTYLLGISNTECRTFFSSIHPQTVCAQHYNSTNPVQSACSGDSGGPLTMIDEDDELTMIGIVSFGSAFGCNTLFPTAYVRPGYYHEWYTEVTGIDFDWTLEETPEEENPEEVAPEEESEEDSEEDEDEDKDEDEDEDEDEE